MSMFEESGNFEGALREKPRAAPRRRRGAPTGDDEEGGPATSPSGGQPEPVKKQGGWGDEAGEVGAVQKAQQGRRAEMTSVSGMEVGSMRNIVDKSAKDDDDDGMLVIPDLEEADEDDMTLIVAEPGRIDQGDLPTNLSIDDGQLPPAQIDGLDLSMLYEALLPKKSLISDDDTWDPDHMLNTLKQQMQQEADDKEALPPPPGTAGGNK